MVAHLFVVDLLKTTEKLFLPELISTFSLSYLSLTFASIIGADGVKSILYQLVLNLNFAIPSATKATLTPQTSRLPDILTYAR